MDLVFTEMGKTVKGTGLFGREAVRSLVLDILSF